MEEEKERETRVVENRIWDEKYRNLENWKLETRGMRSQERESTTIGGGEEKEIYKGKK